MSRCFEFSDFITCTIIGFFFMQAFIEMIRLFKATHLSYVAYKKISHAWICQVDTQYMYRFFNFLTDTLEWQHWCDNAFSRTRQGNCFGSYWLLVVMYCLCVDMTITHCYSLYTHGSPILINRGQSCNTFIKRAGKEYKNLAYNHIIHPK